MQPPMNADERRWAVRDRERFQDSQSLRDLRVLRGRYTLNHEGQEEHHGGAEVTETTRCFSAPCALCLRGAFHHERRTVRLLSVSIGIHSFRRSQAKPGWGAVFCGLRTKSSLGFRGVPPGRGESSWPDTEVGRCVGASTKGADMLHYPKCPECGLQKVVPVMCVGNGAKAALLMVSGGLLPLRLQWRCRTCSTAFRAYDHESRPLPKYEEGCCQKCGHDLRGVSWRRYPGCGESF